ncbi:hypothetical protein [Acidovorax sp.]|uniref:hypothetical protein n=1 Tax=Acidovorax sp. TaxID=1872122 RepID=UPI0031DBBA4C
MKKLIAAVAMLACGSAMANGPYDGLYQSPINPKSFLLAQQNGGSLLVGSYYAVPASGVTMSYNNGTVIKPSELHVWDAFMGPIQGNAATVSGEVINGMCYATFNVTFSGDSIAAQLAAIVQTNTGAAQSIPCSQFFPAGYVATGKRVF